MKAIGLEPVKISPLYRIVTTKKDSPEYEKPFLVAGAGFGEAQRRKRSLLIFQASEEAKALAGALPAIVCAANSQA